MCRRGDACSMTLTILYVEDNVAILRSTSLLLELEGFKVHSAPDRAGALEHLRAGTRPDVIVCDYALLDDDGVQVISCVRSYLGIEVPAVIITGNPNLLSSPGNLPLLTDLVCKPPKRGELTAAIHGIARM